MASKSLKLKVNGQNVAAEVEPAKLLLDFLRDDLGLTGTKEGCGTGDCGACTVHFNGKPVHSCLTLALEANGAEVTTVEGLAPPGGLHPVQAAIVEYGGTQCGFAGGLARPHQIDVDREGNVYIASWDGGWVTKYVPKAGADPGKLVRPPLVLPK